METKANYVLIGFFTLAVLAAAFGFVHWFRTSTVTGTRATYNVVFKGSVGGLRTGATVLFNGMRVGEVSELRLNPHDPQEVIAMISIDSNVPVRRDTYVGLDFQGLTGIANVALKGGDPLAGPLPEGPGGVPTLTADPTATQDITAAARELVRKLDSFVGENKDAVHNTLVNLETFSTTLKNNTERVDRIMAGVESLTGDGTKKGEMADAARAIRDMADKIDKRVDEISPGLTHFTSQGLRNFEALIADARRAIATIDQVVKNFDRNPTRLIFGGGTPATGPAPAARPQRAR